MSTLSKQQLDVENQTSFPNNTTGYITPLGLRTFNTDMIDSLALQSQADSISASVGLLQTFSSSQYKADSSSFDLRIDNIEAWSSSLDLTYATDAQLAAVSVSLNLAKLDTSSFSTYSSSVFTSLSASTFFSGSQYKADSASFSSRIVNLVAPAGTVSSSAQITAFGFATTSSVNAVSTSAFNATTYSVALSASVYLTDVTQSNNIASVSSSAFTTYLSASAWSSSLAFTMNNNSASNYQTDVTQSINITQASASAWGAFQSASAYSSSLQSSITTLSSSNYQINATQSFQITANALTASAFSSSAASTYVRLIGNQTITGSLLLSSSADVELTVVGNGIISGNLDISGALSASIPQGYAWVGGSNNRATLALTSSIQGVQFPYTGSALITGSLGVTGSISVVSGSFSGSVITNAADTFTSTAVVNNIISITAAEYAALPSSSANTLYIII
jgi:hypothetical protein